MSVKSDQIMLPKLCGLDLEESSSTAAKNSVALLCVQYDDTTVSVLKTTAIHGCNASGH